MARTRGRSTRREVPHPEGEGGRAWADGVERAGDERSPAPFDAPGLAMPRPGAAPVPRRLQGIARAARRDIEPGRSAAMEAAGHSGELVPRVGIPAASRRLSSRGLAAGAGHAAPWCRTAPQALEATLPVGAGRAARSSSIRRRPIGALKALAEVQRRAPPLGRGWARRVAASSSRCPPRLASTLGPRSPSPDPGILRGAPGQLLLRNRAARPAPS